ncbi:toprim domain-containing protein [Candidatus Micrarchaeota archaeon]|nr:toprim domain-containing protein [Candidatus Micrarchaeota archaeon]
MKTRSWKDCNLSFKRLVRIMDELKESIVFVEGKKDREALAAIGITNVLTVAGNLRTACSKAIDAKRVIVLTDLDRRGDELAKRAVEELQGYSINANIEYRKILGGILNLKYFEDIDKKYKKFLEELENNN